MSKKEAPSYQGLNNELQIILDQLQSTELNIDEAVIAYERGMILIKELDAYLHSAHNKVSKIKQNFEKIDKELQ